ncbi:MAG: MaoC family dehydratase [Pseudomonadota bacterium]|uniref:MaoC-like domain-containing protein n=1 Tax=marine metagenome TaxID=408172 RepID=A0A381NRR3_9ZZZZ|nr:dehydratase [Gammaproteobacteria bacterium]MEC9252147.1 MaoC family dehydratase [Pseudomonadota bacterium]MEC9285857.1 MaoC family dehydratase [Pseudomonadota bacterium]HBP15573.1 dehydratase [Gammaproteobacteria bacterium]HCP50527.1 dehydratase [Gammaproteobacteria bacterium]|tara:strand:- start:906 stop:1376 length:471 start_codon:yes stop_codon:yes gene_type:complete
MSDAMQTAYDTLQGRIDESGQPSDWFEITQDRINDFADVTLDHQWIHIDSERASAGPFGTTIAHGHLTLSIMGHLPRAVEESAPRLEGQKLMINYGFDKVRFPSPVPVGARVRTTSTLKRVEIKGGMIETMNEIVVEVEGQEKPCCVAESLGRVVF